MRDHNDFDHVDHTLSDGILACIEGGFLLAAATIGVVGALYIVPAASGALADPAASADDRIQRWMEQLTDSTDTTGMYFAGPIEECGATGCVLSVAWPTWQDAERDAELVMGLTPPGCEVSLPIDPPHHPDVPLMTTLALTCVTTL